MSLDSSEELATKARDMFRKCLHGSIPTGNLYSGGLGAYYLLLEQSKYNLMVLEKQHMLSRRNTHNSIHTPPIGLHSSSSSGAYSNHNHDHNHRTPLRCKRLLKQALEGAQTATSRFKRSNSSNLSHQRSCISLLGGEWVGSHTLLAVCYRRLENFSKRQELEQNHQEQHPQEQQTIGDDQSSRAQSIKSRRAKSDQGNDSCEGESTVSSFGGFRRDTASSISSPTTNSRTGAATGTSLFTKRATVKRSPSFSASLVSGLSNGVTTTATTTPKPRSEQVVDKILNRLEKQHLASDDDDDNMTYYTFNSNYTTNTYSSLVVATVWNQDVLSGRAGALQAIWWLRKEFGDVVLGQDLAVSLAVKIFEEGLDTAASMGFHSHDLPKVPEDLSDDCYERSAILFWVCDSQGSHKAYLGAARGVVGILHTLLGLSHWDWELVEEQVPNAKMYVRNTIDVFLDTTNTNNLPSEGESAGTTRRTNSLHERFLYNTITIHTNTNTNPSSVPQPQTTAPTIPVPGGLLESNPNPTPKFTPGNLRPRLDASPESDTTVDWFHGATGLAMLFLEASKVFRSKEYLQEAHRICDAVLFPRGMVEQQRGTTTSKGLSANSSASASFRNGSLRGGRTSRARLNKYNKKGPVGLAGMGVCFLQLSQLCSNDEFEFSSSNDDKDDGEKTEAKPEEQSNHHEPAVPPRTTSLKKLWKIRAALYAQHAHHEWGIYMKAIPTATGACNAYSLYEGMGGLVSLLWQLSLSTFPTGLAEETARNGINVELEDPMGVQLPLYGLGFVDVDANADYSTEEPLAPILLSLEDVTLSETPEEILRPISPPKLQRSSVSGGSVSSQQALTESRRKRAAADLEARKRTAQAEEAETMRDEQAKAERVLRNARRRTELESRKKAQIMARNKALEAARQHEQEESRKKSESAAQKEAEDKSKREVLLLARRQAKIRVDARRRAKEEEELAKARAEAKRRIIDAENKRKIAEEEAKKRRALAEARVRRQKKEDEWAKQLADERRPQEEAEILRRAEELKRRAEELKKKDEQRKQRLRLAELRKRQLRAAQLAKEKEQPIRDEADREKRQTELRLKKEERKRLDAERRRKLDIRNQKRRNEEHALATKKAKEEHDRKSEARKVLAAKEKRRLQLRDEHVQKQREVQGERLREQLQQALDKEVENQRREEKLRLQALEELKMQEALDAIHKIEISHPTQVFPSSVIYSPSFADKKTLNAAHFSVPTKSSLFWSLQTDSNIGSSESYKPALVAADSQQQLLIDHPSTTTTHEETNGTKSEVPAGSSHPSSLSSSPGPVHSSSTIPCHKPAHTSAAIFSRTASTAPSSTVTQQK